MKDSVCVFLSRLLMHQHAFDILQNWYDYFSRIKLARKPFLIFDYNSYLTPFYTSNTTPKLTPFLQSKCFSFLFTSIHNIQYTCIPYRILLISIQGWMRGVNEFDSRFFYSSQYYPWHPFFSHENTYTHVQPIEFYTPLGQSRYQGGSDSRGSDNRESTNRFMLVLCCWCAFRS